MHTICIYIYLYIYIYVSWYIMYISFSQKYLNYCLGVDVRFRINLATARRNNRPQVALFLPRVRGPSAPASSHRCQQGHEFVVWDDTNIQAFRSKTEQFEWIILDMYSYIYIYIIMCSINQQTQLGAPRCETTGFGAWRIALQDWMRFYHLTLWTRMGIW